MKKFLKWFISLAAIGSAIGLIIAYFCKGRCCDDSCDDSQDDTEEDDFDLDSDLEPVPDREYVPLNRTSDAASDNKSEGTDKEEKGSAEAPVEEKKIDLISHGTWTIGGFFYFHASSSILTASCIFSSFILA